MSSNEGANRGGGLGLSPFRPLIAPPSFLELAKLSSFSLPHPRPNFSPSPPAPFFAPSSPSYRPSARPVPHLQTSSYPVRTLMYVAADYRWYVTSESWNEWWCYKFSSFFPPTLLPQCFSLILLPPLFSLPSSSSSLPSFRSPLLHPTAPQPVPPLISQLRLTLSAPSCT